MRISTSSRGTRALAAALGASLLLTACGAGGGDDDSGGGSGAAEGDTTGITETSIKVGAHHPLTGPAAPGYSDINTGTKAYFDYVNANGGICDRQLEYVVRDDGYNPTNTTQVTNQLVLQDEIFAMVGGLGTPTHSAVTGFLNEEEVPDLFVSSGSQLWDDPEKLPYTFGWQPNYVVEGKIIAQYIKDNFPDAKVGFFGQADELGQDGLEGVKQILGEDGVVAEVDYTTSNTDIAAQIAQLQQAGATHVVGFNVPAFTAISRLTAARLNYNPTWLVSSVAVGDPALVGGLVSSISKGAVQGSAALEGTYTASYLPTIDQPDDPWVQLFQKVWDDNGGDGEFNNFRIYGMSEAYTFVQALADSCDNLTRQGIVEAIESNGSDWQGPWLAPLEYSAESHRGITGTKIVRYEGGKAVDQTEVQTSDVGDAPIEEYTEEPSTPNDKGIPEAS